jgi:lipopolysaccharide transport system ATP-binding protein
VENTVIQIRNLSKKYRLGVINNGTLFRDIQTWIALKKGKEDPHSKIGIDKYANSKDIFWALKDINLEINHGDRVGIIGKNGAGKSTLLKVLSRITAPTEGAIKIKGKIASLLEVGTGFHRELTGRENIYLNGAILGMKKRRIDRKIDEIIAFSGIEHHIDTPVKRYSSGMYVRLAFAVAAHLDSDILIADEVLAVGDSDFQKKAIGKMQDLSTEHGRTVLFVSHNIGAVRNLCNCGFILEKGMIKESSYDINGLISNYLNNINKNTDSISWFNNGDIYHPCFTPVSLELLEEDGQPITTGITARKNYLVKFVFNIKELNPFMDFGFTFFDLNGNMLLSTYPIPFENYKPHEGMNTFFFIIPKYLLNEHEYIISLGSSIKNTEWIVNPHLYTISIIMNVVKGKYPHMGTGAIIAPPIKWYSEDWTELVLSRQNQDNDEEINN